LRNVLCTGSVVSVECWRTWFPCTPPDLDGCNDAVDGYLNAASSFRQAGASCHTTAFRTESVISDGMILATYANAPTCQHHISKHHTSNWPSRQQHGQQYGKETRESSVLLSRPALEVLGRCGDLAGRLMATRGSDASPDMIVVCRCTVTPTRAQHTVCAKPSTALVLSSQRQKTFP
jgi:hypothetical protein